MSALAGVLQSVGTFAANNAGTITSALGTYSKYRNERQLGEDQQSIYNMNAAALDAQAEDIEARGEKEEKITRQSLRRLLSSQRALYAKAGVDLSSGSPLTVLAYSAGEAEREAGAVGQDARRSARTARTRAGAQRLYGDQAKKAGKVRAKSTLLSGLGSLYGGLKINQ